MKSRIDSHFSTTLDNRAEMSVEAAQGQLDKGKDKTPVIQPRDIAIPDILRLIFQHCDRPTLLTCLTLSSAAYSLAASALYTSLVFETTSSMERYLVQNQTRTSSSSQHHLPIVNFVRDLTLVLHHTLYRHKPVPLSFPSLHTLRLAVERSYEGQVVFCDCSTLPATCPLSRATCPFLLGLEPKCLVLNGVDSMNPALPTGLAPSGDVWRSITVLELRMVQRNFAALFGHSSHPPREQQWLLSSTLPPKIEEIRISLPNLTGAMLWRVKQYRRRLENVPAQLAALLRAVDPHVKIVVSGLDNFMRDGPVWDVADKVSLRKKIGRLVSQRQETMGGEDVGVLEAGVPFATDATRQLHFVD